MKATFRHEISSTLVRSIGAITLLTAFFVGPLFPQTLISDSNLFADAEDIGPTGNNLPRVSGKLVFSKSPIDPRSRANLTNQFFAGDAIYGALLLDGSMRQFASDQYVRDRAKGFSVTRPGFEVDFQIDGLPLFDGTTKFVFQLEEKEGAMDAVPADDFFIFDIAPTAGNAKTYSYPKLHFPLLTAVGRPNNKAKAGAQYYSFHLGKLKPGRHEIELTITGTSKISGRFTISGDDFAYYSKAADQLDTVAAANAEIPKSAWDNPTVSRSVTVAYRKQSGEVVIKTVLISPDWFVQRNSLGFIIHRGLFAIVVTRSADGKCYMQKEYFKQLYRAGRYGPTAQDGRSETRQIIPCKAAAN